MNPNLSNSSTQSAPTVLVWDLLVRIFHWSLVGFFSLSYVTGDSGSQVHILSGYTIAGLLGFRLVWGIIGTQHARFSDFVSHPGTILQYLQSIVSGTARRYLGHNPAGGIMILLLLSGLTVTVFTGTMLAGFEGQGPLASSPILQLDEHWIEEVHEVTASILVFAVLLHVSGVIFSSRMHQENLVKAMITGRKKQQEKDHD
ncbi:cytochrome b/b6 domain-containing protein [Reinekea blandensis]|uniref:Cytochrome b, putative n=1 Tax=Reinekea blandensis MED297 TaxID=314283 RepID=A4BGK5_9GAMM|nr:cytochrome b/b6 domain-containing protein [Reinekea blandensis]EAR08811.1 cytochrome b, putative [Reinekea sp. MED297] [Reinekea blandensis MED297]